MTRSVGGSCHGCSGRPEILLRSTVIGFCNMTGRNIKERRGNARAIAEAYASLFADNLTMLVDQSFGVILDVSSGGGFRYRTPQPPKGDEFVKIKVAIGEQIFEFPARVAYMSEVSPSIYDVGLSILVKTERFTCFLETLSEHGTYGNLLLRGMLDKQAEEDAIEQVLVGVHEDDELTFDDDDELTFDDD